MIKRLPITFKNLKKKLHRDLNSVLIVSKKPSSAPLLPMHSSASLTRASGASITPGSCPCAVVIGCVDWLHGKGSYLCLLCAPCPCSSLDCHSYFGYDCPYDAHVAPSHGKNHCRFSRGDQSHDACAPLASCRRDSCVGY